MGLDLLGILGLGEDEEEDVIGEEVEAGKARPLVLKVLLKALLD